MIEVDTLQTLAHHLDFEFNPDVCPVSKPSSVSGRYQFTTISEVGGTRYAEFKKEPYKRPAYDRDPVSGITDEDFDDPDPEWFEEFPPGPDENHDKSLHGLVEQRSGHIALYSDRYSGRKIFDSLYEFKTVNGPDGANIMHALLGRTPGIDIPTFEARDTSINPSRIFTAGQITEAIADMKMLAPDVDDFDFTTHDLGFEYGGHGPSWPNTTPAVYRHLSQIAQDVVEQYGDQIHYTTEEEKANRPPEVIAIAKALDGLIGRTQPTADNLAVMEIRIRDGRYAEVSDTEISNNLLKQTFAKASRSQGYRAAELLALTPDAPESERYRRGYWIGMQEIAGVVDTRLVLHEVQPHPEASDAQTLKALNVLNILKTALDRRLDENKDQLLAA